MTSSDNNKPKALSFPDKTLSPEEKAEKGYGLRYVKAMYSNYQVSDYSIYNRISRFVELRKTAEGLQSINKFKDMMNQNGDTSYLNLDWQSVSCIPKFVNIIVGEMINQEFEVKASAMDESSVKKLEEEKNKIYANLIMADFSKQIEMETGVPLVDKGIPVPKDLAEADVLIETTLKQAVEIAAEVSIKYVLNCNNFDTEIKERIIRDLIVIKICAVRSYFDENNDIRTRYVDPINLVLPYTTDPYFRDGEYVGEIKKMNFHDFCDLVGGEMTYKQYCDIAKKVGRQTISASSLTEENGRYYNSRFRDGFVSDDFHIEVLDFEFRSTNHKMTYEKKYINKNNYFLNKKQSGYEAPKYSKKKREVISKTMEVFYEGLWVVGTDYVYKYGLQENMSRKKTGGAYSSEVKSRYNIVAPNIYDMQNKSLVETMIPHDDQMYLAFMKLQQAMIKARPSGLAVDAANLEGVLKGRGESYLNPMEIVEIFDQTGNLYYRSEEAEFGGMINQKPIQELANGLKAEALNFVQIYNYNLEMIRNITGINEARDGSTPSSKALVGVQKMAVNMSRNSTRHLNEAYLYVFKSLADSVSLMIQNKAVADGLKGYEMALGKETVDIISIVKELSLAELGIEIEIMPDAEELAELGALIEKAITAQSIELEDAMEIKDVATVNIKKATQLLRKRRLEKQEHDLEKTTAASQANAEAQVQSTQAAAQADAQIKQMEHQFKMEQLQLEYQLKMQLEQVKAQSNGMVDMEKEVVKSDEKVRQIKAAKKENLDDTSIGSGVSEPRTFSGVGDTTKLD